MIFRGVPESIFASPAKIAVLRELFRAPSTELTGREVARRADVSAPWAIKTLAWFENLGLVSRRTIRPADLWRLNEEHALVPEIRHLLGADDRIWKSMVRALHPLLADRGVNRAVVFGSTARGDERPDSDVDLLVLVKDRSAKVRAERRLLEVRHPFNVRFGNPLKAMIYTEAEWRRAGKLPFADSARREGVVLKGASV